MRKIAILIFLIVVLTGISGCTGLAYFGGKPRYHNEVDYDAAKDFSGVGDYNDLATLKNQREDLKQKKEIWDLTIAKLKSQTPATGNVNGVEGFEGIVANFSRYEKANIVVTHMITKISDSYFLGPGEQQKAYLLPGNYKVTITTKGQQKGSSKFTVGAFKYIFHGKKVHWYVAYDPGYGY